MVGCDIFHAQYTFGYFSLGFFFNKVFLYRTRIICIVSHDFQNGFRARM